MAKSCFLERKKIQCRLSRRLSEVMVHKSFQEIITQQGIGSLMISGGLLIFKEALTKMCQWPTKSGRLYEDTKGRRLCGEEWICLAR